MSPNSERLALKKWSLRQTRGGSFLLGTLLQGALFENTLFQGVTCLSRSSSFKENIENRVGKKPEFIPLPPVYFSGLVGSRETVEIFTEGMPTEHVDLLWGGLREEVGKPIIYEPPEHIGVITEPPYTQKDAERWIAEYEEALPTLSMQSEG